MYTVKQHHSQPPACEVHWLPLSGVFNGMAGPQTPSPHVLDKCIGQPKRQLLGYDLRIRIKLLFEFTSSRMEITGAHRLQFPRSRIIRYLAFMMRCCVESPDYMTTRLS